MDRIALVTGATGLVGKALIRLLLSKDYYSRIIVLSRRELEIKDNRIVMVLLDDFDRIEEVASQLNAHDVYCALGTTMRRAKSREAFLKIDQHYPLKLAGIVKDQPLFEQLLIVTSHGAKSSSPLFYNKVKGELEEKLMGMGFKNLKIFQPSLLLGYRDEFRLWEEVAKFISAFLSFFMIGSKARLWTIRGTEVATAMYRVARRREPGVEVFKPRRMIKIAS
jgi:uncharacterized protein YbjT (DUF2867 family)